MVPILQAKTEAERLASIWESWKFIRGLLLNSLRAENPQWTETELEREIARRMSHAT